ncbi:hypothetical protein Pint_29781 [Pistacia integerrima]|uniref:Uncharacterized protein n=1 Tax=Pistacia integerrima TaxID=434235 RepID=A0ACC0X1R2_9ROSI|nr:hypothetical protein Pint_29781 [Pistacia integerrima]
MASGIKMEELEREIGNTIAFFGAAFGSVGGVGGGGIYVPMLTLIIRLEQHEVTNPKGLNSKHPAIQHLSRSTGTRFVARTRCLALSLTPIVNRQSRCRLTSRSLTSHSRHRQSHTAQPLSLSDQIASVLCRLNLSHFHQISSQSIEAPNRLLSHRNSLNSGY